MDNEIQEKVASLIPHFPYANDMVPYYTNGRILMPGYVSSALAVPLDGEYVVQTALDRSPYGWLADRLSRELDRFRTFASAMAENANFEDVTSQDIDGVTPFLPNGYFSFGDALALTTILTSYKPQQYVEIGSGNSTRFARRAINKHGLPTKITCIDPNPRSSVQNIADEWISKSVVDLDPSFFGRLNPGDVLMLDGSHLVFHGSDTTYIFLRVLPLLKPGVIVHVHDIHLPYEYPEPCDRLFWNEQYLVAMLFLNKSVADIIAPIKYMHNQSICAEGASFWFKV